MLRRLLSFLLFSFAASAAPVHAADTGWPAKPVTVIVASAAGGSADVLTRLVLNHLAIATGANFVVENRPGAAGGIGMAQIARAKPDGYTLGYGNINTMAVNPALFNKLPYDPVKDFTVVGRMFNVYNLLVVGADSPVKSVADLIALAKSKPGGLSYGAAGIGSSGHMGGELFKHMAGIDTMFVPYNGDPASLADLAGGRIDYSFTNASVAWPLVQGGKLRALAITSAQRVPFFPDLPTLAESGLPGYENVSWGGLVFPKGTPDAIVDKLSGALQKVLASDALRADLGKLSARPGEGDRTDFARYIAAEQKKWADLIDTAHIEKQN
ncbi:Bug family tripartite tricarboxylate transporter substrate binding protein [Bordetella tumulicola]|uniref:Bug family tripartite tricarboxylate transporter substrate binding protein n=1 Tax=Bordetella tumulicola TaxID=1649133 RepID=UPI0039F02F16